MSIFTGNKKKKKRGKVHYLGIGLSLKLALQKSVKLFSFVGLGPSNHFAEGRVVH